uniref:Uncharacterized protein n=1 Tax=Oreochromis aureus TaxID=47969 RepID=A0A668SJ35_OREAU
MWSCEVFCLAPEVKPLQTKRLSSFSSFWIMMFRLLFFSFSFSYFFFHSSAVSDLPYLCPNMRVDLVSASL